MVVVTALTGRVASGSHRIGPSPPIGSTTQTGVDPLFSRVVSTLARRRSQVRCWSLSDWRTRAPAWVGRPAPLGPWRAFTSRYFRAVDLPPAICEELTKLVRDDTPVSSDAWVEAAAYSVGQLAHEAQHVAGIEDEATAECHGMQSIPQTAGLLGRTGREGRYLADFYWKHVYPRNRAPYTSADCRNGGRLDLHLVSTVWP
jgi:hypothetical protein